MPAYVTGFLLSVLLFSQNTPQHRPALQHRLTSHGSAKEREESSVVAPAGAIIPLELKNTVNSRTAYVEQAIYAETIFPVVVNEHILIPVHSYVRGEVTEVVKPGRVAGKAKLGLRCDLIVLPDGTTRHISARVTSLGGSRILPTSGTEAANDNGDAASKDDSAVVDASTVGQTSAIVDAGGMLDPSVTGAAEGVGGLVMTLATRGRTIILRPGLTFELQLTQPLDLGRPREADRSQSR
ncbi:MAG TPA: hypothetical protein VGZ29_15720 [Terriglobia bacterium]|nr:hypothetical protein [Terriglobia bacterium]